MKKGLLFRIELSIIIALFAFAAAHEGFAQERDAAKKQKLEDKFKRAVEDAKVAEPSEISKNLTPIVKSNPKLEWRQPENKEVLVVTWINDGFFQGVFKGKESVTHDKSLEMWVTVAPELKDRCKKFGRKDLKLRIEQLLGLPPDGNKTTFIEFWIDPQYLFRPAPDPEIVDQEVVLDFPFSKYLMIAQEHVDWFNNLKGKSYGDEGYPWTRLGYTYDWKHKPKELKKKIGLSEFVARIPQGVTFFIRPGAPTVDYCKK
jgi:hypothetical protein